jgi:hypothetical protein
LEAFHLHPTIEHPEAARSITTNPITAQLAIQKDLGQRCEIWPRITASSWSSSGSRTTVRGPARRCVHLQDGAEGRSRHIRTTPSIIVTAPHGEGDRCYSVPLVPLGRRGGVRPSPPWRQRQREGQAGIGERRERCGRRRWKGGEQSIPIFSWHGELKRWRRVDRWLLDVGSSAPL